MRDTKSIFQSLGRKKKYIKHSKSKIDRPNIWGKINCFLEVITFPSVLFEIFSGVQYFLFWDKVLMWEDQIFKTEERHCSSAEFQSLLPDTDYVIDNTGYSLKYMFTVPSFQKQYVLQGTENNIQEVYLLLIQPCSVCSMPIKWTMKACQERSPKIKEGNDRKTKQTNKK